MALVNAFNEFKESEKLIVGFFQIFFSDSVFDQIAVVVLFLSSSFGERFLYCIPSRFNQIGASSCFLVFNSMKWLTVKCW